jgi:hypothetical protein
MTINFGLLPARTSFTLSSDSDFYQAVTTNDGTSYPVTATLQLRWLNAADTVVATWSATIVAATATFFTDKALVAALLLLLPVQGRVFYEDGAGGPELLLAQGVIRDISP